MDPSRPRYGLSAAVSAMPSPPTLMPIFLCFLASLVCFLLHYGQLAQGRRRKLLAPGSVGLPLLGETLQFALFSTGPIGTPLPFFTSRLRRYGTIFKTHLLGRPTVVSMDPELSKFLLSNDDKLVRAYLPKFFLKILGPTIHLHGASHQAFRELANLSVSPNAVQKLHVETVQEHFLECLSTWQQSPSPMEVDANRQCKEWAFTYAVKYYLGLEADDPTTAALMRDYFILPSGYSSIPINVPGTTFNKVLKARQRIDATLARLVRSRILDDRKEERDFLDMLLKRASGNGEYYSGLHVADWISSFVVAAYENTAVLLSNILKFLSENDHVVDELRRENFAIKSSKAYKAKLTWDDYRDMHFTKNVVKEALRLASIAQHILRVSNEDIHFKGIVIPKNWLVVLNFSMVHYSSNYFLDPLRFDPWRWMDPQKHNVDMLIAFGGGPRRCPGSTLTIFEASVFIHYLVTSFKWRRVHGKNKLCDTVDCLSQPIMHNGLIIQVETLDLNNH